MEDLTRQPHGARRPVGSAVSDPEAADLDRAVRAVIEIRRIIPVYQVREWIRFTWIAFGTVPLRSLAMVARSTRLEK